MIRFLQYILQLVLIRKNLDVLMINIIIQENIYIHTHIYSTNHKGKACSGAEKSSKILNGNIVKYQQTALLQQFVVVQWLSKIARSCPRLFANPQTAAHQAPLFMGFPRQEYQSELPFPSPEDLPNPGIEPTSPALAGRFYTTEPLQ